jgi:transcriptional antiterminator RfaH
LAVYTQPHKETFVRDYLASEGLTVYLPQVRNKVQRRDRRPSHPFFPHYLFLEEPDDETLAELRWTPGVRQIVSFAGRPARIPDVIIQHLKARLKTFESAEEEPFKRGQKVRIIRGPFEGMEAIFDQNLSGRDRVRVFFDLVNRMQVSVEMDKGDLLPPS